VFRGSQIAREISRILTATVVRLIAVALTLVITGAPVVTTACQGLCAERANDGGVTGEHHSCHHPASPANETAITSAPHVCGHSDDGPRAVGQSLWLLAAPAVIGAALTFAPPSIEVGQAGIASDHRPPLISQRPTQLRI